MIIRNLFIASSFMCVSFAVFGGVMINNERWNFRTSTDISNRSAVVDLMERKKGGYYNSFIVNNEYVTTTNIAGDQNNCSQTVSSVGNSGTNVTDATTSSPSSSADGTLGSAAIGNDYQTGLDTALNGGEVSAQGDNSSMATVGQTNESSNQASSINDSAISNTAGAINASGGYSDQQITSSQTNSGNQSASMSDSVACNL